MLYTTENNFTVFLTGTKETNHINFYKITCSLSDDLDQPVHLRSLISLCYTLRCYMDEEAAYLIESLVKTDQTVQMCRLI